MSNLAFEVATKAMREAPRRSLNEIQADYIVRLRAWVGNHPSNDHRTIERHQMTTLAAELLASAERYADTIPEHEKPTLPTSVTSGGASRADQSAYMREYMRERRAKAKAAKLAEKAAQ
jgi:hypothetical protein